jgi:hypothetical protein
VQISSALLRKNFCSFDNRSDAVIEEIRVTGKYPALKRMSLDSHSQPLTEMEQQCMYQEKVEIASKGQGCVSKKILIKELEQMLRNLEYIKQQILDLRG